MISIESFDLGEIDSGVILTDVTKQSAFQRAGQRITISPTGSVVKSISNVTSYGVAEGEKKTASGEGSSVVIGNNKFAAVVVETLEAWEYDNALYEAIGEQMPSAHAKAFDAMVAGLTVVPAKFQNFATLASAQEVEVETGADASVSIDDAFSLVKDGSGDAYVLTTAMLQYLKRQRIAATGARVFDIEGDNNEGVIDGVPYYTITSSTKVGWVGNFADRYLWGTTGVTSRPFWMKDAGNITDSKGVEHNLTDQNKLAVFGEIFQGSGVADLEYFVKIVPAGS